MLHPH